MSGKSTSYDHDAHRALSQKRAQLAPEQVFTQSGMSALMNPYGIKPRECRFSPLYPKATPVMFNMDHTGSMQDIPVYMAKEGLPELMRYLYGGGLVPDPQPLIAVHGDAEAGFPSAPYQIGQFEGEADKIDKYLMAAYLEGGGGGNGFESYSLPLYGAAYLTSIDCHEKQGRRGHCVLFGDDNPDFGVSTAIAERHLGVKLPRDLPLRQIIEDAAKKFHLYFIIPDRVRATNRPNVNSPDTCERAWRNVLGDRVVVLESARDCAAATAALIGLTEGTIASIDALSDAMQRLGVDAERTRRVHRAVEGYASAIGRGGTSRPTKPRKRR